MEKSAKIDNFLQAIHKYADEQRNAMHIEVEQLKDKKISAAERKGKSDSEKYIKDRLEKKRNDETSRLAKMMQDSQKELFLERSKMTENVFKKAEKKLIDYTNTPQYTDKLIKSANTISEIFENNSCVLYVNEKDLENADKINAAFSGNAEILADYSIKIGGIKGYCEALGIVADETLDSKLYAQREWFIENSGLSVL